MKKHAIRNVTFALVCWTQHNLKFLVSANVVCVVLIIGLFGYQQIRSYRIHNIKKIVQAKMQSAQQAVDEGDLTAAKVSLDEAIFIINQEESLDTLDSAVRIQINLITELVRAKLNPTVKNLMSREQLALGKPIINSIGMVLVPIPSGEFMIDSSIWELKESRKEDKLIRQHVKITKPFYLGVYEVTQHQFESVMELRPWHDDEFAKSGPDYAAANVSWEEAAEFCNKLSQQEGLRYYLPTEAQWEYACRVGIDREYSYVDIDAALMQHAWTSANAWDVGEKYAHRVGQKFPNSWGLYDIHGNVWEWCHDWYTAKEAVKRNSDKTVSSDEAIKKYIDLNQGVPLKTVMDPKGPAQGEYRVLRGGSFYDSGGSTSRLSYSPSGRDTSFGFRVARTYQ